MMGPPPLMKSVKAGIFMSGCHEDDADGQHGDNAQLHDGTQVIPWGKQQPDRQDRSQESVGGQQEVRVFLSKVKPGGE